MYKDYPKEPKFSIYRLMIIIWNREVLSPLSDLKHEKNIINRTLRIYKKLFTLEINKLYNCDVRVNKNKIELQKKISYENSESLPEDDLNLYIEQDLSHLLVNNNLSISFNKKNKNQNELYFPLQSNLGNTYSINLFNESKYSIHEDIYTFEFQARYFIEQVPALLLDSISNEYSVFHINDSEFPVSHMYQIFENHLIAFVEYFFI